jgi:hypothetical protein
VALDQKNNLHKVVITLGVPIILLGCTSLSRGGAIPETKYIIEKKLINERILEIADLDDDTREYFQKFVKNPEPGIVCGTFMNEDQNSCLVLLVRRNSENLGSKRLVFVKDILNAPQFLETIEDYSLETRQTTNILLSFQKKAIIENRGEGPSTVQMSQDGVMRVAYGQSSFVLFWDKGYMQKIWTAD